MKLAQDSFSPCSPSLPVRRRGHLLQLADRQDAGIAIARGARPLPRWPRRRRAGSRSTQSARHAGHKVAWKEARHVDHSSAEGRPSAGAQRRRPGRDRDTRRATQAIRPSKEGSREGESGLSNRANGRRRRRAFAGRPVRASHAIGAMSPSALSMAAASRGRTRRAASRPSARKTSVGQSLTPYVRPSG